MALSMLYVVEVGSELAHQVGVRLGGVQHIVGLGAAPARTF